MLKNISLVSCMEHFNYAPRNQLNFNFISPCGHVISFTSDGGHERLKDCFGVSSQLSVKEIKNWKCPLFYRCSSKTEVNRSFSDGYVVKKYDKPYLEIIYIFQLVFPLALLIFLRNDARQLKLKTFKREIILTCATGTWLEHKTK